MSKSVTFLCDLISIVSTRVLYISIHKYQIKGNNLIKQILKVNDDRGEINKIGKIFLDT